MLALMFGGHLFIETLGSEPRYFYTVVFTVVVSIVLHELSHGWAAIALGDRTPIETGHMTPNPVVHMGWTSLILLAVAGIAWGQMPVNPSRLRGRFGATLVALAGPAMNLLLAALALTALGLLARQNPAGVLPQLVNRHGVPFILYVFGELNLVLLLFNLIPVPPLDGSRVAADLVPAYRRLASSARGQTFTLVLFLGVFWASSYLFAFGENVAVRYILLFVPHAG